MKDHNIFYVPHSFFGEEEVVIKGAQFSHINKVLRKKRGDIISLSDGRGHRYEVELGAAVRSEVHARIIHKELVPRKHTMHITLGFVPVKGSRNDTVVEKGTELGVARFIIFASERSVLKNVGKQKIARFQRLAQSAMIQSQQYYMPEVIYAPNIADMLQIDTMYDCIVVADPSGRASVTTDARKILLLIGPEGGFTDSEIDLLVGRGALLMSLGDTRLRSETAAIVAVTKILVAHGQI
ncbi:MAG: 16S rRNA (uracil(1498)-N(3))-methyltransferase [candidate division WOR-3 bacterium]|nr:MAG: 16S rRNA (uracil(1498)-N(3))-methyltransferase [candidate division WOR-3 bacterium]